MPSITDDISEFMGIPYKDVVKRISQCETFYLKNSMDEMFPWGIQKEDMYDFYKSDQYSAYLFWKVVEDMENNKISVPQTLANTAEGYVTQPRILIYGAGTGWIAMGLRLMHLDNENLNFKSITIADVPSRYFEFLKFFSKKYSLGFEFITLDKEKDNLDNRYDLIVFNSAPFRSNHIEVINNLVNHLEQTQYIYLNGFTLPKSCHRTPELIKIENMGLDPVRSKDDAWRLWQKKIIPIDTYIEKSPANPKDYRTFPSSIACLSSLPDKACGVATYTQWLSNALKKHYPVKTFRDINQPDIPKAALILASIEFGLFEDTKMLIKKSFENNWKFAIWHTVLRDPHGHYIKYLQEIDAEYDAHIVHTVVQKNWLSKYVGKPVYLIPHGSLIWNPMPSDEAKEKLGLSKNSRIAFVFGFAADNKGLDEIITVSKKINIPDFNIVMSAGVNTGSDDAATYTGYLKDYLKNLSSSTRVTVLGKYLSEFDINLWASAADILIFNYKTPPYVGSASGAMKRVLAAGKPIICVNDNRLEELVDGQHCLKFQSGDIDAFAHCIELLLSDKQMAESLGNNCRTLALNTSWDITADKMMGVFGETIKGFGPDYYDEAYFSGIRGGKTFVSSDGETREWSYYNVNGEWLGAEYVMKAIRIMFFPMNMLSVGEGRGTFVAYAADEGIDAVGIDFSRWAIDNPYPRSRGLVHLGDVRNLEFDNDRFDLLFCSDILEHIYLDDLPKSISEIQRVAKKWIFYNIGASMLDDKIGDLVAEKNKLPPKDRLVTTVAGHVTVKNEKWWRDKLGGNGWVFRDDLVKKFRELVPPAVLANWKCIIICEKTG